LCAEKTEFKSPLKGATAYVFHAYGIDEPNQRAAEKALAANVLAKL
jgi:hypothetical protein